MNKSTSQEYLFNGIQHEEVGKKQEIIITSTCLDDDQMVIFFLNTFISIDKSCEYIRGIFLTYDNVIA
jgi:hypothetical protein